MALIPPNLPLSFIGASLNRAECVLTHSSGVLIAADWTGNGGVSVIAPDGRTGRVLAAEGQKPLRPNGIALDEDGSILVAHLGETDGGIWRFMMVLGGAFTMREGNTGFAAAFLPLYALFLDATATLALRVLRGEDVSQPHRSHLYQVLANGGWGHGRVSLLYGATALVGVAVAGRRDAPGWWGMMVAYAAVVLALGLWLRRRSRAGGVQEQSAPDSTKT
jgi:hypothetical protein